MNLCWVFLRSRHDARDTKQEGEQWIRNMREILPAGTRIRQIPVEDQAAPVPTKARQRNQSQNTRTQQHDHPETLRNADNLLAQTRRPHPRVGGMTVLVSHRWSNHIKNWWAEPSGFGLAGAVTLSGST
jgi:hypothetical protein